MRSRAFVALIWIALAMHVLIYVLSTFSSLYLVAYLSALVLIASAWAVSNLAAERGESRLIALLLLFPIIGQMVLIREVVLMIRRPRRAGGASS